LNNTNSVPLISGLTGTVFGVGKFSNTLGITSTSLPAGVIGAQYTATTLKASGGNPPYTWKLVPGSGKLPKGLKLNKRTGVISGTPKKTARSSIFTVEVLDNKVKLKHHPTTQNTATKVMSITIS
jgi:hypothetical protein